MIALLLNTTYDEVEENEGTWSEFAQDLEISQTDYKLVVRVLRHLIAKIRNHGQFNM